MNEEYKVIKKYNGEIYTKYICPRCNGSMVVDYDWEEKEWVLKCLNCSVELKIE